MSVGVFRFIRWTTLVIGVGLPFATWFVASELLELKLVTVLPILIAAMIVSAGLFHLSGNYLQDRFARSLVDGGTWDFVAERFGVASRPADVQADNVWSGFSQLDQDDVVFETEAALCESGIYVNVIALGRILIPWGSIAMLKRDRLVTERGWQQMVSLVLDGPEIDFRIPWDSDQDSLVPESVGID